MLAAKFPMKPGDAGLSARLIGKQPPITVDSNGGLFSLSVGHPGVQVLMPWLVGTIRHGVGHLPANEWFGSPLSVTPRIPLFTPSETEHEATNRADEQQPPSTIPLLLRHTPLIHTESDTNTSRVHALRKDSPRTLPGTFQSYLPVCPISVTADATTLDD